MIVSLDFIEGLPRSNGYDTIMVVIDKFSKYAHFVHLAQPFIDMKITKPYMHHIYRLHGLPKLMISDWDKVFKSILWQQLFIFSDTELIMSSAHHP